MPKISTRLGFSASLPVLAIAAGAVSAAPRTDWPSVNHDNSAVR
jgi:hypothetical protein